MIAQMRRAVSAHSRAQKMREFFSMCPEGSTVLDVGVSGARIDETELNCFLRRYPRNPSTYTGLGVEDLSELRKAFPAFRFVEYEGGIMPFANRQFDWVFSNAVIEHVGDDAQQLMFVDEMLRVSRAVYFTTPNRWFPVETHSGQLLLHWHREAFDQWATRRGFNWLTARELRLLGFSDLMGLMRRSSARDFQIRRKFVPGVPWPMTFSVIARA